LGTESQHRRNAVAALGGGMFLLLLALAALNAFNPLPPFLRPHGTNQILLFTALSVIAFLLLLTLLILLFRNIVKLLADQRSRVLGSRIRSRMLVGALLLSFAPAVFMFLFSFGLLNRAMERWFSQPSSQMRQDSTLVAMELSQYAAANARAEAESLASSPSLTHSLQTGNSEALLREIATHRITLEGGFAVVYRNGAAVGQYQLPQDNGRAIIRSWMNETGSDTPQGQDSLITTVLHAAQRSDVPMLVSGTNEYMLGAASTVEGCIVVAGLPLPAGLSATVQDIRSGARDYETLYRARRRIRTTYLLLMFLLTTLIFFASSWLALFLSKQVTRPVEALADAMDAVAAGHYAHRVKVAATEELGELVRSFNRMAEDLEESRALAETSTTQLSAANRALEERRSELETVLETIPSAVVTLDPQMCVLQANRASRNLLSPREHRDLAGKPLESILPREIADELIVLLRRSKRMGLAATEIELPGPRGALNVTATIARLELGKDQEGCILVLEDVTDFLHAQRQVAWKEVAQRVAHEIKNPLTPIALSAERIRKHVDRPLPESDIVIRKCSEVILGSVQTMRRLVDQFASLAQFPTSRPKVCDLNSIVESALALFAGRLHHIRIVQRLGSGIPPVLADPEALKRALANLIDNAAEAMQSSLLRELTIETGLIEGHTTAEIVVADTGHGLNDEMRERLFLPYFSTKQRGTGLGLAIASKIIQEHSGAIRAEQNSPTGARFIIELPLADAKSAHEAALVVVNGRAHA
jgi:two-component system, NtrC family, nitrogen regulation sensor histidine kinase NtrY